MYFQMPKDFLWGAASASYQVEGAATADGKGASIWDVFCKLPGVIKDGSSGEHSCRSYEFWKEDIQLLKNLGVHAYRFSISWPRVMPDGRGTINQKGLDFYSRFVDALLANNIQPFVTLYHWDLPLALETRGGWQTRETAEAFAEYTAVTVKCLGDRVKNWMTFNEIATGIGQGYGGKGLAPGLRLSGKAMAQVYHHSLVAHGLGIRAIRAGCPGAQVSLVLDPVTPVPVIEDAAHIKAAGAAYEYLNGYLTDPLFRGNYPKHLEAFPDVKTGDMELISEPMDFLGLNIYSGIYCEPADNATGFRMVEYPDHYPMVRDLDWMRFVPQSLYWAPRHAHKQYGCQAIYITENGYATDSLRDEESLCNDIDRILALRCYLRELHHAIGEGIPVRGYFHWSLVDHFEWIYGYTKGLGLHYCNRATGARRPKRSAAWYQAAIRENAIV